MNRRPHCLYCGKPLQENFTLPDYSVFIRDGGTMAEFCKQKGKLRKSKGTYGYAGSGLFCTLRCGFWYSVDKIKDAEYDRKQRAKEAGDA